MKPPRGGRRIHRHRPADDVERELAFHIEMRTQELIAEGWTELSARREAIRLFGDTETIQKECTEVASRQQRSERRSLMLSEFGQDIRYATRWLIRERGFTLVAVLTLALGMGANAAAFGVVNSILLAPLPYPQSERLVMVQEVAESGTSMNVAWPNYLDWAQRARQSTPAAHLEAGPVPVLSGGRAVRVPVARVSRSFFDVLGVQPVLGRGFSDEETVPDGPGAVVVSDAFWRQQLGSEADLSRQQVSLFGKPAVVVGVMPPGFSYPAMAEVWHPVESSGGMTSRTAHNFVVTARLAPGATTASAQAELTAITLRIRADEPEMDAVAVAVSNLRETTVSATRRPLLILLGASAFVLLIACTNLAGTLLARNTRRTRELAIRASLGAPRLRLVRQLLTESLLLSLLGAATGLMLAALLIGAVHYFAPASVPRIGDVRVDGWVLGFTALIAVATALTFGVLPALRATASRPWLALAGAGRGSGNPQQQRAWTTLVAAEVALALVLLVGSGLLIRSFWNVLQVDPGFNARDVAIVTVALPEERYRGDSRVEFYNRVLSELSTLPGAERVALSRTVPLAGRDPGGGFGIGDMELSGRSARYRVVSHDYFETLRVPLLRGRTFNEADRAGALDVIVINRTLAERYFPDRDPLGAQITTGGMDQRGWGTFATVIGIVGDVRESLTSDPAPAYYLPYTQRWDRMQFATILIRSRAGAADEVAEAARSRLQMIDPEVPAETATLSTQIGATVADRRFIMVVLGSFAGIALLLAAVGIYGVVSFIVAQRTREIGIRVALGAEKSRVLWLVSRTTMRSVLAGTIAGIVAAALLSRFASALLYGVDTVDPLTFAAVALLLAGAAWLAVLIPASRALRVNPATALRSE